MSTLSKVTAEARLGNTAPAERFRDPLPEFVSRLEKEAAGQLHFGGDFDRAYWEAECVGWDRGVGWRGL